MVSKHSKRITILANQLLKLLENYKGEVDYLDFEGRISYFWEVSGDEGTDSYNVDLKFNAENEKFPIARIVADFYEEGEGW